jgi:large subunit ribosomal protein L1
MTKRLRQANERIDREKLYGLDEAVGLVKANATAKFDETIELAINLGVDSRQADQSVRGVVLLPHGIGKYVRVAVFARDAKAEEAKAAGADIVGAEALAEQIQAKKFNFDRLIATPNLMPMLGRLGKILGPRSLMPNPKYGTVTNDITQAVKDAKHGQVLFKLDKSGIIHGGIAVASFTEEAISDNLKAVVTGVIKAKPSAAKGTYIKRVAISSTMGPGVKLDPIELTA